MPFTLIRAKLARPHLSPAFIVRPSLMARLDDAFEGRVTLISAPAGAGKSILATQWVDRPDASPSAWLSLDRGDSDLDHFTRYLIAALAPLVPGGLPETEALLASQVPHPPDEVAERIAGELEGMTRGVLVLDELEAIETERVHDLIRALVPAMGRSLHIVLLSRVDPPLPLSLWRTRHWAQEIRGSDLVFTPDEVGQILEAAGIENLSPESLALLHAKTEGWAAGLRLAQLSLSSARDPEARIRALSGTSRLIADYLVEEVLAEQPGEVREFLGVVAHLDRFRASLCDYVLSDPGSSHPRHDSAATLDRLYRNNAFVVPLVANDSWYRFHTLFRQFLLDRASDLAPKRSREDVLRRAGEWHEREGYIEEALRLLVGAGALDAAADLLARHLQSVLDQDPSRRTLARWLSFFPEGAAEGRLPLHLASLYVRLPRMDFPSILKRLQEMNAAPPAGDELRARWSEALRADILGLMTYAEYWSGELENALRHATEALARPRPAGSFRDSISQAYRPPCLAGVGEEGEYERFASQELIRLRTAGGHLRPHLVGEAAVTFNRADFAQCRRTALEVLELDDGSPQANHFSAVAQYLTGAAAYEQNDLDEAEARFGRAWALRFDTAPFFSHHAALGLAAVPLARGDREGAAAAARTALEFVREFGNPANLAESQWFDRRLESLAGTLGPALPPLPAASDFIGYSVHAVVHHGVFVHLRQAGTDWIPGLLRRLDHGISRASATRAERPLVQLSLARALVLQRAGRHEEATAAMAEVLERAEAHGFIRSFVDYGRPAHGLLLMTSVSYPRSPWLAKLLEAFGDEVADSGDDRSAKRSGAPRVMDLTRREYSVLRLLQLRLSNKEIAARLFISAETVRKHTINIYRKLGVGSRRQAVNEAVTRGLLTSDGR